LLILLFENSDAMLKIEDEPLELLDIIRGGCSLCRAPQADKDKEDGQKDPTQDQQITRCHRPVRSPLQ
jgi:hypothetical protein